MWLQVSMKIYFSRISGAAPEITIFTDISQILNFLKKRPCTGGTFY